jgi:transitional endoplasmic reticulum ATPase
MFKLYLKKRPVDFSVNYEELAKLTDNYVSSDIKFLVDEASRVALEDRVRITHEILVKVISETNPSVSRKELRKYELLKDELERSSKQDPEVQGRPAVGFKFGNNK